jgi:hypothetical protein
MAITELYSGTETVSTTEWSMSTDTSGPDADTTDGVFQAFVELNNLAAGDIFVFRVYEKVLAASTQRLVFSARFAGVQGAPVWASPSLVLMHGWDMTLLRVAGSDRAISWSIRQVA